MTGNIESRLAVVCGANQERHSQGSPFWQRWPGAKDDPDGMIQLVERTGVR
jgi:hypothetical protein